MANVWTLFWPKLGCDRGDRRFTETRDGECLVLIRACPSGVALNIWRAYAGITDVKGCGLTYQADKDKFINGLVEGGEGSCWEFAANKYSEIWHSLKLTKEFDLPLIVDHPSVLVLDESGKEIDLANYNYPTDEDDEHMRLGKWLSGAGFSNSPDGETEGPSGLNFL